jgi:hypothetical protein
MINFVCVLGIVGYSIGFVMTQAERRALFLDQCLYPYAQYT